MQESRHDAYFSAGRLSVDHSIVLCEENKDDPSPCLTVDFGHACSSSGQSFHICIALDDVEHVRLVGGFKKGERVNTLIAHTLRRGSKLNVGDEGTVIGPCNDAVDVEKHMRVCVDMGPDKGGVNFICCTQLHHAYLAGGFQKNDRVRAIAGFGLNFNSSEAEHVNLKPWFDLFKQFPNLKRGDEGVVVRPCDDPRLADADKRVCVCTLDTPRPVSII